MTTGDLITPTQNTWCPGCGNFAIEHILKEVITGLINDGTPAETIVLVTGIGCHAKMADYLGVNSFYSLHGRTVPVATGIKVANPDLTVICCVGDGDCYGEGLEHLLFAAKRNVGITVIVHNNRVYGLTTGQYTPTSPEGFPGKSTPHGTIEHPINPLTLLLSSGAGWVGRGYTRRLPHLKGLIDAAVRHQGFAALDVLQICATFYNRAACYNAHTYDLADHDPSRFEDAYAKAREWDYTSEAPIPLGIFFDQDLPRFEDRVRESAALSTDTNAAIGRILDQHR